MNLVKNADRENINRTVRRNIRTPPRPIYVPDLLHPLIASPPRSHTSSRVNSGLVPAPLVSLKALSQISLGRLSSLELTAAVDTASLARYGLGVIQIRILTPSRGPLYRPRTTSNQPPNNTFPDRPPPYPLVGRCSADSPVTLCSPEHDLSGLLVRESVLSGISGAERFDEQLQIGEITSRSIESAPGQYAPHDRMQIRPRARPRM